MRCFSTNLYLIWNRFILIIVIEAYLFTLFLTFYFFVSTHIRTKRTTTNTNSIWFDLIYFKLVFFFFYFFNNTNRNLMPDCFSFSYLKLIENIRFIFMCVFVCSRYIWGLKKNFIQKNNNKDDFFSVLNSLYNYFLFYLNLNLYLLL